MEVVQLKNWEEFVETVEDHIEGVRIVLGGNVPDPIFRGQENEVWKLETTLERFLSRGTSLLNYFKIARGIAPQIEALTNKNWHLQTVSEYEEYLRSTERYVAGEYPELPYFAYLMHHGFPSPLLDWTASPYVAAFFAFRNPPQRTTDRISIYAYVEYTDEVKVGAGSQPYVFKNGELYYRKHEDVVALAKPTQDLLWKFTLPVEERKKVLTRLRRMNITAYSLFRSEDSLLETIATNDLFLEGLT